MLFCDELIDVIREGVRCWVGQRQHHELGLLSCGPAAAWAPGYVGDHTLPPLMTSTKSAHSGLPSSPTGQSTVTK
jgi:hypothetical protein